MKNKKIWISIALSTVVLCWGIKVMLKPQAAMPPAVSLENVLMENTEYIQEVYRAHENYAKRLHDDTCAVLIYRYSTGMCSPCYTDDLSNLKRFRETIGKDIALARFFQQ